MNSSSTELSRDDVAAIHERCSEVERYVSTRNYAAWANCFTPNAVFMFANSPTAHGRAAIEAWGRNGPKVVRLSFSGIEIHGCGSGMAWMTSGYQLVIEGAAAPDVGKQLVVFKRRDDGAWLAAACSASSDLPPQS
jgi:ketosteroid isomerase-like protein